VVPGVSHGTPLHPLEDPRDPLKTQYNPLKPLLGPPDFGLRDLWLSGSYHPRRRLHLMEAGARTVVAPPREEALRNGGYRPWHRDYGSDGVRLPIGSPGGDYSRVKCFVMLKDTSPEGGPLGLVPASHLFSAAGPPAEFQGGEMAELPGHVKVAVPAGGMVLFDMVSTDVSSYSSGSRSNSVLCVCSLCERLWVTDSCRHAGAADLARGAAAHQRGGSGKHDLHLRLRATECP
jgi:hypothetical protein